MSSTITFLSGAVIGYLLRTANNQSPPSFSPTGPSQVPLIPATPTLTLTKYYANPGAHNNNNLSGPSPASTAFAADTAIHPATVGLLTVGAFAALPLAICVAILGLWLLRLRKAAWQTVQQERVAEHGLATVAQQQERNVAHEVAAAAIHRDMRDAQSKMVRVMPWFKRRHAVNLKLKLARVKSAQQVVVDRFRVRDEECCGLLLQLVEVRGEVELLKGELQKAREECCDSGKKLHEKEVDCISLEEKLEQSRKYCIEKHNALQTSELRLAKVRHEVEETSKELEGSRKSCIEKQDALEVSEGQLIAIRAEHEKISDELEKLKQEHAGVSKHSEEREQQHINLQKKLKEPCKYCDEKDNALEEYKKLVKKLCDEGEEIASEMTEMTTKCENVERMLEEKATECKSLQENLDEKSKESTSLQKKLAEQVVEHKLAIDTLQQECTSVQEHLEKKKNACITLQEQMDLETVEHGLTIGSLEDEAAELEEKLEETTKELNALQEQRAMSCNSCIEKKDDLEDVKDQLKEVERKSTEDAVVTAAAKKKLANDYEDLRLELERAQQQLKERVSVITAAMEKSDNDDRRIKVYENLFDRFRTRAGEEKTNRTKAEQKLLELQKETQLVTEAYENKCSQLQKNHQSDVTKAKQLLDDSKAAVKKLEKEKNALLEKNNDLKSQLHDATSKKDQAIEEAVDLERAKLENERKRLVKDGAIQQSRSDRIQKELDSLKKEHAKILETLRADVAKLQHQLAAAVAETSAAVCAKATLVKEVQALKTSHALTEEELKALREQGVISSWEKNIRLRKVSGSSSQTLVDDDLAPRKEQVEDTEEHLPPFKDEVEEQSIHVRLPGSHCGKNIQRPENIASAAANGDQGPTGRFEDIFDQSNANLDDVLRQALTRPGRRQSTVTIDVSKFRTVSREGQATSSLPTNATVDTSGRPETGSGISGSLSHIPAGRRAFQPLQLDGEYFKRIAYHDPRHPQGYLFSLDNLEFAFVRRRANLPRRTKSAPPGPE